MRHNLKNKHNMNVQAFINGTPLLPKRSTNKAKSELCPCSRGYNHRDISTATPRMKLISHEKLDTVFKSDDGEMANYKLTIEIPGDYSKKKRRESVQTMRKNANFPGFRKGTIPPFIFGDINTFVFRDSAEEMIDEAVKQLDLSRTEGENREAKYDAEKLKADFEVGTDFSFECEVVLSAVKDDVIDVDKLEPIVEDSDLPAGLDVGELEPQQTKPPIDQAASSA